MVFGEGELRMLKMRWGWGILGLRKRLSFDKIRVVKTAEVWDV